MKNNFFITLAFLLYSSSIFSQQKDSLVPDPEMQRLNRMGDSLYQLRLAKESAYKVQMNEILQKTRQDIERSKQKEVEEATQEVMAQQEKEQKKRSNTKLWALVAFSITIAVLFLLRNRTRKRNGLQE